MTESATDLIDYYANLLISQYLGKPRAFATIQTAVAPVIMPQDSVQTITFPLIPDSGTFILQYGDFQTTTINWNDSTATIQTKIQSMGLIAGIDGGLASTVVFDDALDGGLASTVVFDADVDGGDAFGYGAGLGSVLVTGSIAGGLLTVYFAGVPPPVLLLVLGPDTLLNGSTPVVPIIAETSLTLPLAVQNAFNLVG